MRGDTTMSAQRARGFLSESKFFYLANQLPAARTRAPRGYVRMEQATPIMDVRGIDGFVVHYRGSNATAPRRIPVNFKCGADARTSYVTTHCGMQIPVLGARIDMTQGHVFEQIRLLLDAHDRRPRVYDENRLRALGENKPTNGEREVVDLVERSRAAFNYSPALPMSELMQMIATL
jgi:hypothetical protein